MAGRKGKILTLLCSGCCGVKIEGDNHWSIKMMINKENSQQSLICANYYHYYLSSFFMHSLYLRKMPGRTLKVYVEDKCCVKYQTAHFEENS